MDSGPVKVTGQRVARRIRELRLERSLTLADLAAGLAEIDQSYTLSTLSRIEQGKRRVDTDDLVALAFVLDVPPNAILFPPSAQQEPRTKLTANIEFDTSVVLRWAASGEAGSLRGKVKAPAAGKAQALAAPNGPVYRTILAVDIEGSTRRPNAVKAELRHSMYSLMDRALRAAGLGPKHLEPYMDRGDGIVILIRPHDDVPKSLLLDRLIPQLAAQLVEHNATAAQPELQLRLRAVLHAGEVQDDDRGFFGEDLDVAFRLLESPVVKRELKNNSDSPLAVVVSDEVYSGAVWHRGPSDSSRSPVQVRVGNRQRRGWINIPTPH
jgi:transcriptional regulator with XRE-family HTH domain